MEASDEESPGAHPQGPSLEDPLSDEFGLSTTGPGDGTDLGGKPKEDKTGTSPPWSELKTKAGKERKRLPLACIACRRKKIRCSGEKPACKHCLRSRIPCVYKVTTRKAAPRTDYMAMLDKRLKRMEDRIIKIVPKSEQDGISSSVTRANVKPAIPGTLPSGKGGARKRGADEAFGGPDLEAWAKAPVRTNLETLTQPSAAAMLNECEENKLLQEGSEALPGKEIQEHLADVFFESVYGQAYHILHKPSYMRKLRQVDLSSSPSSHDQSNKPNRAGALPPVLILSVCAMSARFSSHPSLTSSSVPAYKRGEEWASVARDIATKRYEWPNITILNCLIILGLNEFATCQGRRSWSLGGQAIRMAFALQLHKDLDHDPLRPDVPLSFIDREIRRRTMWACFIMDRLNSSGTDRPSFIKEELLRIPLPVKEKNFQLDMPAATENLQGEVPGAPAPEDGQKVDAKDNMGVAAYMVKAISLWGRVMSHLNQGGKDMDVKPIWDADSEYMMLLKEAEELANSLPESLVYNLDNRHLHETESMVNQFFFLHIAIQQNILFLHRFAVNAPKEHPPMAFVTTAGKKSFDAANRISELLNESEPYLISAPFIGYCAFLSSTVHIFGIFSDRPSLVPSARTNLAVNVKFLSKMKRYWGLFDYMGQDLRERYLVCYCHGERRDKSPKAPKDAPPSAPIFQYGDWFDRFPHGLPQSDFVDPAIHKQKEKGEDAVLEQKPEMQSVGDFLNGLSPQSKDGSVRSGSISTSKRKASAAKRGSNTNAYPRGSVSSGNNVNHTNNIHPHNNSNNRQKQSHHQLEPVLTNLTPEQIARLQHQGGYPPNVTLGGQSSGATTFAGIGGVQHPAAYATALSPISPVAVSGHGPFGGVHAHAQHQHQHQHPHQHPHPHPMYAPDMLALQLGQNGLLQQHPMLGGYGHAGGGGGGGGGGMDGMDGMNGMDGMDGMDMDPTGAAAIMDGLSGWDGSDSGAVGVTREGPRGAGVAAAVAAAADGPHNNPHHTVFGHGHDAGGSTPWFLQFSMDAPDVGDVSGLGSGIEFGAMFGSGARSGLDGSGGH